MTFHDISHFSAVFFPLCLPVVIFNGKLPEAMGETPEVHGETEHEKCHVCGR